MRVCNKARLIFDSVPSTEVKKKKRKKIGIG